MKEKIQQILHEEIPLTRSIGITVEKTGNEICLSAPLENNINHKRTAFGGSLYSVAVLTGWSMVYQILKQHQLNAHIVIAKSEMHYSHPVDEAIVACCQQPEAAVIERMLTVYAKKKRAKIELEISITCKHQTAALLKGIYVIHA